MTTFGTTGHNLTNGGNGAWSNTAVHYWTYDRTFGNDVFYKLNGNSSDYDIKYDGTNWTDVGSDVPNWFGTSATDATEIVPPGSATTLYFWVYQNAAKQANNDRSGAVFLADIINNDPQTTAGGTSTEGVSVANGSITRDSFGALYFTVDKSSPLTVGTHDYGFYLDGFLQGTINHSLSTLDAIGYQNNPSDGLWQLSYQGGSSVQVLASYVIGRNKKVHANFW